MCAVCFAIASAYKTITVVLRKKAHVQMSIYPTVLPQFPAGILFSR